MADNNNNNLAAPAVQEWVEEFKLFCAQKISAPDARKRRVALLSAFLSEPGVRRARLHDKVRYARFRGYPRDEIEDAFAPVDEREYLSVLEGHTGSDGEGDTGAHASHTRGAGNEGGCSTAGDSVSGGDTNRSRKQTSGGDGASVGVDSEPTDLRSIWRVRATVYAYKGDSSYYPVPLIGFDESRTEDVLVAAHQLPSGDWGPRQYFPAGFKGMVPDEFAPHRAVRPGVTVIAEYPRAFRNHFKEAVVLRKSDPLPDGSYTVDLEWVHTSEVAKGVDSHCIRLLEHPRIALQEIAREEEARRSQGISDRISSGSAFLVVGQEQSGMHGGRRSGGSLRDTDGDRRSITGHVRSFHHYPHLDQEEQPRSHRTLTSFVSQYGDSGPPSSGGKKIPPLFPASQADLSGLGYGFNLTMFARHPASRHHYTKNPIVEIAEQCAARDTMFVDPDFPPSFRSLYGPQAEQFANEFVSGLEPVLSSRGSTRTNSVASGSLGGVVVGGGSGGAALPSAFLSSSPDGPITISWRRASELLFRPRVNVIGSKPIDMQPGFFTPPWMLNVLNTMHETAEFEDMISPGEGGWVFGAYVVRLFVDGRWAFVVVDDFLPCNEATGKPLCLLSGNANEIYCCLVEKAIAKLEGSYMQMKHRRASFTIQRLWEDCSSSTTEFFDHDCLPAKDAVNENILATVTRDTKNCRMHCRCRGEDPRDAEFGFEKGAYWYVDGMAQHLPVGRTTPLYFFHVVRAPKQGAPVPNVDLMREKFFRMMPPEAVDYFPEVPDSAVSYWMSSSEYYKAFDRTVCLWFQSNAQKLSFEGTFAGRPNAGAKMHGKARWLSNPQIFLSFMLPTEVVIELKLTDRRIRPDLGPIDGASLQLHVLRGPPLERPLTDDEGVVASSPMVNLVDDVEFRNHPSTTLRLPLSVGNYILIPNVGGPSIENFVIKVFSVSAFHMKLVN